MRIFISLTTVPKRLADVPSVIENITSLLNQKTDKEYKVIFNIPYVYVPDNSPYIIPAELQKLADENPKLILNRINTDRGPIEKVVGGFNIINDPEDIIIALDDDHAYEDSMIEYILKKLPKYPNYAVGFRGDNPLEKRTFIDDNGNKKFILISSHGVYFPVKHDTYATIPGHWHSVTYRRKFIQDDFFTDEFLGVAKSDDLTISYYLRAKKIHFIMLAYDDETNFIPVNSLVKHNGKDIGTPSSHYPIKRQLSMPSHTGFAVYRNACKENPTHGVVRKDFDTNYINCGFDKVYDEDVIQ